MVVHPWVVAVELISSSHGQAEFETLNVAALQGIASQLSTLPSEGADQRDGVGAIGCAGLGGPVGE